MLKLLVLDLPAVPVDGGDGVSKLGRPRPHYARGRLVVTPLGVGAFQFAVLRRADKWAGPERMEGAVTHVDNAHG